MKTSDKRTDVELLNAVKIDIFAYRKEPERWIIGALQADDDVRAAVADRGLIVPHEARATFSERGLAAFKGTKHYANYQAAMTDEERSGKFGEIGMACRCAKYVVPHPPHAKDEAT